jgi:hypothetical protein
MSALLKGLSARYPRQSWSEEEVRGILDEFDRDGLTMREDNLHLALAVLPLERELSPLSAGFADMGPMSSTGGSQIGLPGEAA